MIGDFPAWTSVVSIQATDWEASLQQLLDTHFAAAHGRVDSFYRRHFLSLREVLARHWRHRRDVPRDLANVPRMTWRLARKLVGKPVADGERFSGKELALADAIATELLDLPALERSLLELIESHPALQHHEADELRALLSSYTPEECRERVAKAVAKLGVTQEGGRDLLIFLGLGLAGRALGDKIAFGSAALIGSTVATSLYIGQQSFFAALWSKWFGAPAWVSVSGALGGFVLLLLATPVFAPFLEVGVNRFRARSFLHETVDQLHRQLLEPRADAYSFAGYVGTCVQLIPDLLAALRSLK